MAANNWITIKVNPSVGQDPDVHLSDRAPQHKGNTKIQWIKDPDWVAANPKDDFDFIALAPDTAPLANPFSKINITKNHIKCDFAATSTDPKKDYPYMLVIEYKGVPYDTNKVVDPNHGRAVIRN